MQAPTHSTSTTTAVVGSGPGTSCSRRNLIETAARFLENARVQGSPLEMQKNFLLGKGLTEQEVSEAFSLAKPSPLLTGALSVSQLESKVPLSSRVRDISARIRDVVNVLLLIGGFSYGLRYIWKRYISPWLFGEGIEVSAGEVNTSHTLHNLLTAIHSLQEGITKLQNTIEHLQTETRKSESGHSDVRKDIQSLKSLLLASRSFPQNPTVSPAGVPAWQLTPVGQTESGGRPDADMDKSDTVAKHMRPPVVSTWDQLSGNGSSASEIEMLSSESSADDATGEDGGLPMDKIASDS